MQQQGCLQVEQGHRTSKGHVCAFQHVRLSCCFCGSGGTKLEQYIPCLTTTLLDRPNCMQLKFTAMAGVAAFLCSNFDCGMTAGTFLSAASAV